MHSNNIAVKIKYKNNRSNPAEVFEAMGLYIRFHTDIGQILLNTLGENYHFDLSLEDIEKSSILSWLSPKLDQAVNNFYKRHSNSLVKKIVSLPEEITDQDIENIAKQIQEEIQKEENPTFAPIINKKALKHAIKNYSAANEKIYENEPVEFISYDGKKSERIEVNVQQRLKKEDDKNELENSKKQELNLIVVSPKNVGHGAWTFKSQKLNQRFDARITNKEWLRRYQAQIINPIGPKDIIVADVRFIIDKETKEITKAEILDVKSVIRAATQRIIKYE